VEPSAPRERRTWEVVLPAVLLALIGIGAWRVTHQLIPSLGVIVVGSALFVGPRVVAGLAAGAILITLAFVATSGWGEMSIRLVNVVLASAFAVSASVALDRRFRRIESLGRTEAAILSAIPDAVLLLDGQGRLVRGNAGLSRLVPAATPGQPLHPLLGHVLADGSPCPGDCPLDGRSGRGPGQVAVDGERITVGGRLVPVAYTQGRAVDEGIVVVLRDVSARVTAEEDRRVLLEEAARGTERRAVMRMLGAPGTGELAAIPGLAADVWSTPGDGAHASGGDLLDVSALPDGRALLLIVDASGDGLASLRDAWKVSYMCRAHLAAGAALGEMIARAGQALAGDGDGHAPAATVAGIILDVDTGHLQVAMGGHPPPLLVRANGSSEWLEAPGQALGEPRAGSQAVVSTTMDSGDTLVLYTDGAVDGADDVIEGLGLLRSTSVALRTLPLPGLARRALESVQPGGSGPAGQATVALVRLAPGA
jgi:PAS domain-containing protein